MTETESSEKNYAVQWLGELAVDALLTGLIYLLLFSWRNEGFADKLIFALFWVVVAELYVQLMFNFSLHQIIS